MIGRMRRQHDPFWDDGQGARRTNRRVRIESSLALLLAISACVATAAVWIQALAPLATRFGAN
jgi:hypothetical protein